MFRLREWFSILLISGVFAERSLNGTVYLDLSDNHYTIVLGTVDCDNGIACGYFDDTLNQTGWGVLEIRVDYTKDDSSVTDDQRMYAAGLLEGYLTSEEIYYSWSAGWGNYESSFAPYKDQLINWTDTQAQWINKMYSQNKQSLYWQYVQALGSQYQGTMDGYNRAAPMFDLPTLGDFEFQFLNGNQDFFDIIVKLDPNSSMALSMEEWLSFKSPEEFMKEFEVRSKSRCSAIVKVTPLLDDIFIAHSTWSEYFWMNRVFKHYLFKLKMPIPTTHMAFSSYPASLSSIDDWYVMDSGIAVVETTNDIFNKSLFSRLIPETLLSWQRARIANALASTAKEWTQLFAEYNSGTYNNQWIALQFSAFVPNQPLPDGLVWIAEQIPGNVSFMDVTSEVERGYWGSYNIPAIEYIYKISGNEEVARAFGPSLSYDLAPRARIFRRDANNCNNMTTLGKFMRYNNYLNDPIENNDPSWAVMSRYDLSKNPSAFGGVDTKMSNLQMMQNVYGMAQSGPTHDDLPPFVWTTEFSRQNDHIACPIKYDFGWVEMKSVLQS